MSARPILGLTMGDPAGIGPEICLRAMREPSVLKICTPVLFGDAGVLRRLQSSSSSFSSSSSKINSKSSKRTNDEHEDENHRVVSLAEFENISRIDGPHIVDCA